MFFFFFSSRRRHTRFDCDWSSDVCSSDLIDRAFSMRGFGTVVTGTMTSGALAVDDELVLQPSERRVKVRGVQVHGTATPNRSEERRVGKECRSRGSPEH